MATESRRVHVEGDASANFQDEVTETYVVTYDSRLTNFYAALVAAQAALGTHPVPPRRALYPGTSLARLFASRIAGGPTGDDHMTWTFRVTYSAPPPGELNAFEFDNPLARPPRYNVEYREREYVVQEARNVDALPHGNGDGGQRNADTLGPITNSVGEEPDEPLMDTEWLEVLVVRRNYPTLGSIVDLNRTYKRTTNSDTVQGYQARELRYLLTESEGLQFENGVEFWPGVTTILAEGDTDLSFNNVGFKFWDAGEGEVRKVVETNEDGTKVEASAPVNLAIDGTKSGAAVSIEYRHLTPTSYAPLIQ